MNFKDREEVKKYWGDYMPDLKEGCDFGNLIIGRNIYRNMEILLDVKVGTKLELYDVNTKKFVIGTIEKLEKCTWQTDDNIFTNSCNVCPGKIKLYELPNPDCFVNSPFTYIKRIIGYDLFNEKDFEL